ncbi:MAG TPA: hypothetical protein VNU01_13055, partial [Egibacteraceae bacterium]|nr:hypothetical protein [Egibacteraceae bacterium]
ALDSGKAGWAMGKRARRQRREGGGHGPAAGIAGASALWNEPDFLAAIRRALRQDHPWNLLSLVSVMLEIVDPRSISEALDEAPRTFAHRDELVELLISSRRLESTAMLAAISEVAGEPVAGRIHAELAARDDELPGWLTALGPLTIDGVFETDYVLGDGNHVLIGAQTAAGHPFTCMVYIDHNFGTVVKDGGAIWAPIESVAAALRQEFNSESDCGMRPLDPATARVRITQAIEAATRIVPPLHRPTWPAARPVAEWVVRHLPDGGAAPVRTEWGRSSREGLMNAFLSSSFGEAFEAEARDALDQVLAFACDFGAGDPLRWSPARIAVLLTRWLPMRLLPNGPSFRLLPDVLRAFVRYSHAEQGVRADLTADTLAMVDECEPDFRDAVISGHARLEPVD